MSSFVHLHFVKQICMWISYRSILCLMSGSNHNLKVCGPCEVALIPKYNLFELLCFFSHPFISTFLFHHYILLLYITFGGCGCCHPALFTLEAEATLGWLHFRNVAPNSLLYCFSPTTFICLYWVIAYIYPYSSSSFTSIPVFILIITTYGPYRLWLHFSLLFIPALSFNHLILFLSTI